jgi:SAM-dependent methyltransferase
MSGPYLHGHHASVLRSHSWRTVDNSAPHLIPYLKPNLKVLDVGCGPGTITVDLASRLPQGFVYAIDPSADVIEKARQHAQEKGVTNVRFEVGDIHNWQGLDGVEEGSFDVVHAHQVLQHLQDPLGCMKEMVRLTKKGGIVAVRDCDYGAMDWYPEHSGMQKWKDQGSEGLEGVPQHGQDAALYCTAGWDTETRHRGEYWILVLLYTRGTGMGKCSGCFQRSHADEV